MDSNATLGTLKALFVNHYACAIHLSQLANVLDQSGLEMSTYRRWSERTTSREALTNTIGAEMPSEMWAEVTERRLYQ